MREADAPGTWDWDELNQTPEVGRARVARLGNELTRAELDVRRRREDELAEEIKLGELKRAAEAAETIAQLSPEAPLVERGGTTVADKAAWVQRAISGHLEAVRDQTAVHKAAKMKREAAVDHYKRVDTQASLAQSLLKSIDGQFQRAISER